MIRTTGWVVGMLLTVSCAGSHQTVDPSTDAGTTLDAHTMLDMRAADGPTLPECVPGDPPPPSSGCVAVTNYHCSDAVVPPECVNGAWECTVPNDGTPCMCYGALPFGCFCTAHGQECEGIDMGPPDSGIGRFVCGDVDCISATEYCLHLLSDVVGTPDMYSCNEYPSTCSEHNCACFDSAPGPGSCSEDADGNVTVIGGGG